MKKLLLSTLLVSISAISGLVASKALYSDTERSTGNVSQTGVVDLKVDSECTYNGVESDECGFWSLKDLEITLDKFFNFTDLKPGDYGENTISLHVNTNDAWVCAEVSNLTNLDNTQTEPEALVDTNGLETGELQDALEMTIWRETDCNNILDSGEVVLATGSPIERVLPLYDSTTGTGALIGSTTACLGVAWSLPMETGNEVQTDSLTGDISFYAEQARHNDGFICEAITNGGTGTPNGNDDTTCDLSEKAYVCHYDAGKKEYKTLCLPLPAIENSHLKNHDNDYLGQCADETQTAITLSDYEADPQYGYTHDYGSAHVSFVYNTPNDNILPGTVTAIGLKPYATYQLKFEGKPTCAYPGDGNDLANEYIGYEGRWWNNTTNSNTNDAGYLADSDYNGGADCITGYLVWGFITADASGNATKTLQTDSSYHVLWSGGGVCDTNVNNHLAYLDAAHPTIWFSPADKVNGELERGTCGGMTFNSGNYELKMILNEESFHQGPGTWTAVMGENIEFSIN
ncbi:hypothetical protein ACFL0C_00780 [Patescibacteria group bacterium]